MCKSNLAHIAKTTQADVSQTTEEKISLKLTPF